MANDPVSLARNRDVWAELNDVVARAEGEARWAEDEVTWGLFRLREADLGLLGPVAGLDVVELGCGTAYVSGWLARAGARPVAVDLSHHQLLSARAFQRDAEVSFPLVEATAEHVPLADRSFDLVVSEYGASPWCDPTRWLAEAARLLRPGGRLIALTNSVLAGLCVPEAEGHALDRLQRPQRDLARIEWPGGGVEHHPSHGEWIAALVAAGLVVDELRELYAPEGASTHEGYEIVTAEWARRWPAEEVWVAHRPG